MDDIMRRLEKLERQNRCLKQMGVVVLAGFLAVLVMGQVKRGNAPEVVEAQKFVVRDGNGRVYAELGFDDKDMTTQLILRHHLTKASIRLSLLAVGLSHLTLTGHDGTGGVHLANQGFSDDPHLLMNRGKEGAWLYLGLSDGLPGLRLYDMKRKGRAALELLDDGSPSLRLSDADGRNRAVLGHTALEMTRTGSVEQRPASSLVLFDKDGKVLWAAP